MQEDSSTHTALSTSLPPKRGSLPFEPTLTYAWASKAGEGSLIKALNQGSQRVTTSSIEPSSLLICLDTSKPSLAVAERTVFKAYL